jgi:crotonobetainyl-CoA:carnitine CoA-transferase CaiB-like acyl-CoA transferase
LADRTAFDLIAQATGGTMYANHQPDRPPGVFFADLCAGAFAAIGILAALYERQQTGRGKLIDVSMQAVMYFHNFWAFSERATAPDRENIRGILGGSMQSLLSDPDNPMPFWNSYVAADGHVAIVALTDRQWRALMDVIGRPDMADDPRFANLVERIRHAPDATRIVSAWTAARPVSEVVSALAARQIPCGPVNDYDALNQDPQLAARGMLATAAHLAYGEVAVPGFPLQFDGQTAPIKPGPELAEHTDAVLRDWLNLPDEEIITLRKRGIIV